MENESWGDNSAFDIVSDILKMKASIKIQKFFAMNKATKEKITRGSTVYNDIILENDCIPDDIIVSFNPSTDGYGVPEFINTFRLSEKKLPELKPYEGNRKQRREAERANRRRKKHEKIR